MNRPVRAKGPVYPGLSEDLVGAKGFEPSTSRSRTERSTRLSHAPTTPEQHNSMWAQKHENKKGNAGATKVAPFWHYLSNSIIRSDFPVMKKRARRPATRSVPVPASSPIACGYH